MRILVVESDQGLSSEVRNRLTGAGHSVVTCTDFDVDGPCRTVAGEGECPVIAPTDAAVVVRHSGSVDTLNEMGAVCAERRHVPVVHIDPSDITELELRVAQTAAAGKDRGEAHCARQVREAIGDDVAVEVERAGDAVRVRLMVAPDVVASPWRVADRAAATVRRFDPDARTIDVSVVPLASGAGKR